MMLHFQRLFEQASADPARRLSDFVLLDDRERRQILEDWNDTAAPILLHKPFQAVLLYSLAMPADCCASILAAGADLHRTEPAR